MANQFDPFAAPPAPSAASGAPTAPNPSQHGQSSQGGQGAQSAQGAQGTSNPFDVFGTTNSNNNSNNNFNWQQSARAVMANGSNAWKNSSLGSLGQARLFRDSSSGSFGSFGGGGSSGGGAGGGAGGEGAEGSVQPEEISPGSGGLNFGGLGGRTISPGGGLHMGGMGGSKSPKNGSPSAHSAKRIVPYEGPIGTLSSNWDPWLYVASSSSPPSLWNTGNTAMSTATNANNSNIPAGVAGIGGNGGGNFMTYLLISGNEGCKNRISGGVENVLKWGRNQSRRGNNNTANTGGIELDRFDSSLSLNDGSVENFEDLDDPSINSNNLNNPNNANHPNTNRIMEGNQGNINQSNPPNKRGLHFLKSGLKKAQASIERSVTTMAIRADGGKNPDWICASLHYRAGQNSSVANGIMGRALGMEGMLGMSAGASGGVDCSDICLSRTEWMENPGSASGASGGGLSFSVPLCVPDLRFLEAAATANTSTDKHNFPANNMDAGNPGGVKLTLRLYLRSGATLLKAAANAGLKREYCVGECTVLYSGIVHLTSSTSSTNQGEDGIGSSGANAGFLTSGSMTLPFTSGMLADPSNALQNMNASAGDMRDMNPPAFHVTVAPRIKLSPPCTLGWSLTDPTTLPPTLTDGLSPNCSRWMDMFQLPLDQGYAFSLPPNHQLVHSHNFHGHIQTQASYQGKQPMLLTNERAVESTLVLPLATAASRIFALGASQSQRIAGVSAARTCRREALMSYSLHPSNNDGLGMDDLKVEERVNAALNDGCVEVEIGLVALILLGGGAVFGGSLGGVGNGSFGGGGNAGSGGEGFPQVRTNLSFQRHDSIFEEALTAGTAPLLDETSGKEYINNPSAGLGPKEAITTRFCPRMLSGSSGSLGNGFGDGNDGHSNDEDASLLPGIAETKSNNFYVGTVRVESFVAYAAGAVVGGNYTNVDGPGGGSEGGGAGGMGGGSGGVIPVGENVSIEGILELEPFFEKSKSSAQPNAKVPFLIPAIETNTGRRVGTYLTLVRVRHSVHGTNSKKTAIGEPLPSAASGLISLVGLDVLTNDMGLAPYFDSNPPSSDTPQEASAPSTAAGIRRRQIATMGSFLTPAFLRHQAEVVRGKDATIFADRYDKYQNALVGAPNGNLDEDETVELFKRRTPRPFRPSNSRGDPLLAGIGFNVHVQSMSLNLLEEKSPAIPAALHYSVTHGAPSDHAKGFGVQGTDTSNSSKSMKQMDSPYNDNARQTLVAKGGLRRLESTRLEIAKELEDALSGLIHSVGQFFQSRAQIAAIRQQAGMRPSRHVPPGIPSVVYFRGRAVECAQRLHALTWDIAVRRANCFSQALGIACTSYLAAISDGGPASRGFASVWAKHGYFFCCEGLLSAVGKELGMIEDASVAVEMLRMVNVVLVSDDLASSSENDGRHRVPVPHSPYVRWVHFIYLTPNSGSKTQYRLEIGLDPSYYQSRVPEPLKGGTAVRFYPVLFQMGVDIRQFLVNAGRNVTNQKNRERRGSDQGDNEAAAEASSEFSGGLIDDGDDDDEGQGESDNEILMALNVEGFKKMNQYAHTVNPVPGVSIPTQPPGSSEQPLLPAHPILASLGETIRASAGKMEHGVLDKAATACQRLGGGSTVFCKSGKDRTAMQVTFKQAQFLQRFINKNGSMPLEETQYASDKVFAKATLMRIHGTRVPICEKNAGEAKYAFNPLQAKFMPEMLKPPPITLAGFLKKPET